MREAHDPSGVASTTDDARRQFRSEAQNGAGQLRLRRCASPSHFMISAVLTRLALGLGGRGAGRGGGGPVRRGLAQLTADRAVAEVPRRAGFDFTRVARNTLCDAAYFSKFAPCHDSNVRFNFSRPFEVPIRQEHVPIRPKGPKRSIRKGLGLHVFSSATGHVQSQWVDVAFCGRKSAGLKKITQSPCSWLAFVSNKRLDSNRAFEKIRRSGDQQCRTVNACSLGSLPDCSPASSVGF
jgi:hypothetical protein